MANYRSPGVYIVEENAFPNSAVAVETAIPAFIGYTFKAERDGKSLHRVPTKINSFAEYIESFGGAFKPSFLVSKGAVEEGLTNTGKAVRVQSFKIDDQDFTLRYADGNELYLFNSIRLFYANGGGSCVILSVGTYEGVKSKEVSLSDFKATEALPEGPLDILKNEQEPTLIVIPDIAALGKGAYSIYKDVLTHCSNMQSRFGVFDLRNQKTIEKPDDVVDEFRTEIGTNFLNYGAAYYPWLNTGIVDADELTYENLPDNLSTLLEPEVKQIFDGYQKSYTKLNNTLDLVSNSIAARRAAEVAVQKAADAKKASDDAVTAAPIAETALTEATTKVNNVTTDLEKATKAVKDVDPTKTDVLENLNKEVNKQNDALKIVNQQLDQVKQLSDKAKQAVTDTAAALVAANKAVLDRAGEAKVAATAATSVTDGATKVDGDPIEADKAEKKLKAATLIELQNLKKNHNLALKSSSAYYRSFLNQARNLFNEMPPSAAMVGLYTMVDNTRGVWKAPANYSLNSVNSPIVNISSEAQQGFNVDPYTGKSVNVIRPFQGLGTLVWGGRTLDGNSSDWKYINVRRTLIMIEQSLKAATRAYVFEPNNANTWLTVKSMFNNFLTNLWKQGALAGAAPEQAFEVNIGLGSTMTPTDILDGKMLITVKVAIVRPAEFIVITFQQQLQQS
ncbi:phage tail sheath family protein [Pedobacter gandavensis]|uniref:Tail sheath protein C-terminal domain-containing protein n=1 Tax=Pedobacter gandavensis TaxID=2679963 RepID=A0ABR6ERT2_9SPHI|nr:phage tail sheath family protein [Pedobacter gandavensis]MBB2147964.1 hypothetical protein [Pedobacter gandavensis]